MFKTRKSLSKVGNNSSNKSFLLLLLNRTGLALGGLLLIGNTIGIMRLRNFVSNDLSTLLEKNLVTLIDRPVELGDAESYSLGSVVFDTCIIPATPNNPNRILIGKVIVNFDPAQLLFNRKIKLDVTFINPRLILKQDKQNRWLRTSIILSNRPVMIEINLEKIFIKNGDIILFEKEKQPGTKDTVFFRKINGYIDIKNNLTSFKYQLNGQVNEKEEIEIDGEFETDTKNNIFLVRTLNLPASQIFKVLSIPVALQKGRLTTNLKVKTRYMPGNEKMDITGYAGVKQATGTTNKVFAQTLGIPEKFDNITKKIKFKNQLIVPKKSDRKEYLN